VYFADTWLGHPRPLGKTPGHHRFVWDLRLPPPPTLHSYYSIAAVPERETPVLPRGAYVLPGSYLVRLVADGATIERPLQVVMDPRVGYSLEELVTLLDFQLRVADALGEAVALARGSDAESGGDRDPDMGPAGATGIPAQVASALTGLAIDLEHSDAPPTAAQRAVLRAKEALLDSD
jgi:hypothetical protein